MSRLFAIALCSMCSAANAGQAPESTDRFGVLAPLVGHCYTAPMDEKLQDEQCFESLYEGAFVRSTHIVSGGEGKPYQGVTMFSWDGRKQRVRYHYFTSTGAVSEGHVEVIDGVPAFVETHVDQKGNEIKLNTLLRVDGERGFSVETRVIGLAKEAPPKFRQYRLKR